ncbi:ABC transporter ATP-binding protein [soil metagenome]
MSMREAVAFLQVSGLSTSLYTRNGWMRAVDGVDLSLEEREIVGIVGESGCGKSVMAMSLMGLNDPRLTRYGGSVMLGGIDLLSLDAAQWPAHRGSKVAMIFQDPLNSLNPLMSIGDQIVEPLRAHRGMTRRDAAARALELLKLTEIPDPAARFDQFPHELSGGMRQRVMIAIALACEPRLLIADEPTTALDVTIQAQVLALVKSLSDSTGMSVLMITHDLGVVREMCHRVAVMYLGQFIEVATVGALFERPLHPYTRGLLASMPSMATDRRADLATIPGSVPPLDRVPSGCRFSPRCSYATERCGREAPLLEDAGGGHLVRCWNYRDIAIDD